MFAGKSECRANYKRKLKSHCSFKNTWVATSNTSIDWLPLPQAIENFRPEKSSIENVSSVKSSIASNQLQIWRENPNKNQFFSWNPDVRVSICLGTSTSQCLYGYFFCNLSLNFLSRSDEDYWVDRLQQVQWIRGNLSILKLNKIWIFQRIFLHHFHMMFRTKFGSIRK